MQQQDQTSISKINFNYNIYDKQQGSTLNNESYNKDDNKKF
jgi:hypothetical protein